MSLTLLLPRFILGVPVVLRAASMKRKCLVEIMTSCNIYILYGQEASSPLKNVFYILEYW